jgi:3-methyladenine DNA glycosylase AlkD
VERAAALVREIRAYCRFHADPQKAKKYERYFKEGYDAWGLLEKDDPLWIIKQPAWLEKYRDLGLRGFLKVGEQLFASGKYEEGALAIRFLKARRDEMDARAVASLTKWFAAGIANWAHTDMLCGEVLTPLLVSGRVTTAAFEPWRKSKHRFQRRASVVALLGLVRKGDAIKPLAEFARPLMLDDERVVHQGVGWFLREAWKKEPQPVEALLLEFKNTAPRLIFQYATEKMTPAQKTRFKKDKQ